MSASASAVFRNVASANAPVIAVAGLNLEVASGEILGFLGPNGAGKSTTVKILTGLIRPGSGRASICGFDVIEQPLEVKKRLGYVPETPALVKRLLLELTT